LPGFSREEQKVLWALVRSHRRAFKLHRFVDLHKPYDVAAPRLTVLLRLAVILNRSRRDDVPFFKVKTKNGNQIRLKFEEGYLENSPLLNADLVEEAQFLAPGFELKFK
jgi:exopolyphosphatase/guanosine-5'-triphosphate,3'-diphosphate pyrophosphatase